MNTKKPIRSKTKRKVALVAGLDLIRNNGEQLARQAEIEREKFIRLSNRSRIQKIKSDPRYQAKYKELETALEEALTAWFDEKRRAVRRVLDWSLDDVSQFVWIDEIFSTTPSLRNEHRPDLRLVHRLGFEVFGCQRCGPSIENESPHAWGGVCQKCDDKWQGRMAARERKEAKKGGENHAG